MARQVNGNGNGDRPVIGVTMGDPAGIGPEIVAKALADPVLRGAGRFVIYGLHELIEYAADQAEINPYWFRVPREDVARIESGVVVADFDEYAGAAVQPVSRSPTAEGATASMQFVEQAIQDARRGVIDGIVTGPIHKAGWKMAGYHVPGHTELLAKRFKAQRVAMMFVGGPLRVALASIHVPLFELRNQFTIGLVFQPIDLLHQALREWFDIPSPKIAVCGLNPHAGEAGLIGDEETRIIEPAIDMARQANIDARGPFPADSLFWRAARGEFDGVVAMYHDQGLIPVKLLAFDRAVNLTIGLPVVRTSVDHGTAFDIAGRNKADCGSMKAAVELAIELTRKRLHAGAAQAVSAEAAT